MSLTRHAIELASFGPIRASERSATDYRPAATATADELIRRTEEELAGIHPVTREDRLHHAQVLALLAIAAAVREQPLTP